MKCVFHVYVADIPNVGYPSGFDYRLLHRRTIMDDSFIRDYVEDLLKKIRTQVLCRATCRIVELVLLHDLVESMSWNASQQ